MHPQTRMALTQVTARVRPTDRLWFGAAKLIVQHSSQQTFDCGHHDNEHHRIPKRYGAT